MAFDEIQFPTNISRGARGGPRRKTQIAALASGDEERNASWLNSRRQYDVAYGVRRADDLAAVVAFFEARNGMLYGFRFKDWADYKSCAPTATPAATDQNLGTGNAVQTTFQLRKAYTSGARTYHRSITKPVAGTVLVALNGVPQGAGWTVNTTTGIVTFAAPPGAGVVVAAGFEFDVPVRFDTDMLDVTLDFERLGSIASIPLIEVRK
ncbi:minor tail protein [Rhodobacter phage RcOceanus]|nr:minor tail protein [Rhodobacter phage RcOceanus]